MKPNWYTLASLAVFLAGIIGSHYAHLDDLYKILMGAFGVLVLAVLPAAVSKGGDA
jgi:hypothetical protein